jgi:NAD(P)H-dependent FMN reductase
MPSERKGDPVPRLQILIASSRPIRAGEPVAGWFKAQARAHGGFELEVVDLRELDLPLMNEPKHPRFGDYEHQHTRNWSAMVARADAFAWVLPEYNYGYTAPLKNAFDYLHSEWLYKPVGFVSYGGIAGGTRAVQLLKPVVTALKMVPLSEAVPIPFVASLIKDGVFEANQLHEQGARMMLDELLRVEAALRPLRPPRSD